MRKIDRVNLIRNHLDTLYPNPAIPLKHNSVFELLIAVVLSAQCTDERVNKVTELLFARANTPFSLANTNLKTIYDIIRPCGLAPKKSHAIHSLSNILIKEFKGKVPPSFVELEKLPGVGHKTASVVMSQGYGHPAFPVDTHIHRLAQRWGLTNGKNVIQTERDLKKLFPMETWNKLHLQIIYYGREFCTARSCFGLICEICKKRHPKRKLPIMTKKP